MSEVRWGLIVLVALAAIAAWIGWRGTLRPHELYGSVELTGGGSGSAALSSSSASSIVPSPLAEGWNERERSEFITKNLYEKINGRADFFTSKGFERLYFVSLVDSSDETRTIDLELYDMGSAAGALSAFTAERKEGVTVNESPSGQHYISRNAMFMVQGKYYGRALGVDESEATSAALEKVRATLTGALESTARSWALALFVDELGFAANKIRFEGARAFSLEAAKAMWIATIEEDAEIFISVRSTKAVAQSEAEAIVTGFASYGTAAKGDPVFVTDEFINTVSAAVAVDEFIVGVRAAPNVAAAKAGLEQIRKAVASMSAELRAQAVASAGDDSAPVRGTEEETP